MDSAQVHDSRAGWTDAVPDATIQLEARKNLRLFLASSADYHHIPKGATCPST